MTESNFSEAVDENGGLSVRHAGYLTNDDVEGRDSGVEWLGCLPDHWELRPLKRACTSVIRKEPEARRPYLSLEHIESGAGRLVSGFEPAEQACDDNVLFEPGDVLFGKLRPYLSKSWLADRSGCCPTELLILRPFSTVLDARFLYFLTLSNPFVSVANGSAYGVKMPRTSWEVLSNQYFPVPPLDEQRAIAAFLDRETAKIDSLIEKKRQLSDSLAKRRIVGVWNLTFGATEQHADNMRVKYLGKIKSGAGFPKELQYQKGETFPFFKVQDLGTENETLTYDDATHTVSEAQAKELGAYIFPKGSIVFAKIGAALMLGRFKFLSHPSCLDNNMMGLIPYDSKFGEWVYHCFFNIDVARFALPGAVPSLDVDKFGNEKLPIPGGNVLAEQLCRVKELNDQTTNMTRRLDRQIGYLREYRTAVISAAVTGQIDVRGRG